MRKCPQPITKIMCTTERTLLDGFWSVKTKLGNKLYTNGCYRSDQYSDKMSRITVCSQPGQRLASRFVLRDVMVRGPARLSYNF
ncbi:hypothetical protein M408DRAFT_157480 [Serendipita vermifera MAFF 305830]|uniref:Uncharacterized protein n=1 Tax=Serendipita vermifera MAFF 305830 TaxID=933852 RepID=A0A0C3BNF3_SERVB|nr:hypothetical protein M408DRAFT_157480 [Serendipita vermifera MAFF 305830]